MGEHGEVTAEAICRGRGGSRRNTRSREFVPIDSAVQIPSMNSLRAKSGMSADLEVIDEVIPAQEPVFLLKFQPGQLVSMTREFRLVGYDINPETCSEGQNVEIRGGMESVDTTIVSHDDWKACHCTALLNNWRSLPRWFLPIHRANLILSPSITPCPGEDLTGKSVR